MNTLELEYISPYLPYDLKMRYKNEKDTYTLIGLKSPFKTNDKSFLNAEVRFEKTIRIRSEIFNRGDNNLKPILRPLLDIVKEINTVNKNKLVVIDELRRLTNYKNFEYIERCIYDIETINLLPYWVFNILLEHHFDVFGLIEKGLAIDFNTIKE